MFSTYAARATSALSFMVPSALLSPPACRLVMCCTAFESIRVRSPTFSRPVSSIMALRIRSPVSATTYGSSFSPARTRSTYSASPGSTLFLYSSMPAFWAAVCTAGSSFTAVSFTMPLASVARPAISRPAALPASS